MSLFSVLDPPPVCVSEMISLLLAGPLTEAHKMHVFILTRGWAHWFWRERKGGRERETLM